ncbi:MAG TPA: DUF5939 domain-containing protein, partial [Polyangiaceae bacterium]
MGTIVVERKFQCRADPAGAWCVIADTERLNRHLGLGRLEVQDYSGDSGSRYLVKTVSGAFPLEYEEQPFEWVENERFSVRRIMKKGLARSIDTRFELTRLRDGGTEVTARVIIEPKYVALSPAIRLQAARFISRVGLELEELDEKLKGDVSTLEGNVTNLNELALERAGTELFRAVSIPERPAAELLVELVRAAHDAELDRMRPLELAEAWNLDERIVLAVFLRAVSAGLLELNWDLVCPSCRTASKQLRTLQALPEEGHCQLCDLSYGLDLDLAVEATFRPSPAVRHVDPGPYCIGGPRRTPHVLAQSILQADGVVRLSAPEHAGRYRVFARGGAVATLRVEKNGAKAQTLRLEAAKFTPHQVELSPGAELGIEQVAGPARHVKIERMEYASRAATAHLVSTLPEFRRSFANEVLRPGLSLRVGRVALLFTDLTASTALYAKAGDARAFKLVQDHFELLRAIIERRRGVLVKTIGDAVMAAFVSERDAIEASVEMQQALPGFRAQNPEAEFAFLKVGVFAGPCYMVTANDTLDYFGQSVNVAARLQATAGPGEVVLPSELATQAEAQGWLGGADVSDHFVPELKGITEKLSLARVVLDPPSSSPRALASPV